MNRDKPISTRVRLLRLFGGLLTIFVACGTPALAADVVYLAASDAPTYTRVQIETATRFYGFDLEVKTIRGVGDIEPALRAVSDPKILAVVINADALSRLRLDQILASAHKRPQALAILVAGITGSTPATLLSAWSGGAISSASVSDPVASAKNLVAPVGNITRQLGGIRLPLARSAVPWFTLGGNGFTQTLMEISPASNPSPTFLCTRVRGQEMFFATEVHAPEVTLSPDPYRQQAIFSSLAAPMIFLRFAGGDRAWHTPGNYANFTIDDLWLREPYGHVNFEQLLGESQAHNFHTTIAFIPWNFDRSQPAVVSLFLAHPERLSICIHGNNHVHQEFGPLAQHPLERQVKDIGIAVARMERFKQLTGIPYDPVMVFPHSVSPSETLAALKQANYLGTANSLNVPSNAQTPAGIDFALRTASLRFADFPSLRRYSAESEIPEAQIAIDTFLGNPMLFYAHESFFASGITAFDDVADRVNRRQPGIQWTSLGEILQHSYLERTRVDGSVDIRADSSSIRIRNTEGHDTTFIIRKDEDFTLPLSVLVDGQPHSFERAGNTLELRLPIAANRTREISIRYGNLNAPPPFNIARGSLYIAAIRLLSDFRDNFVSNTSIGRRFIHSYADLGPLWNRAFLVLAGLAALVFGALYLRRNKSVPVTAAPPHATR